jgi:cytochrome c-type biogenesis protein CcmH/NrfF
MLRATTWTLGLFGAGTALTRVFASGWVEPLVLLLLGAALLYVSARTGRERRARTVDAAGVAKPATASAT